MLEVLHAWGAVLPGLLAGGSAHLVVLAAVVALAASLAVAARRPGPVTLLATRAPYASARGTAPGESCPVAQSDPDGDVRPRPRAPGRALPTAA